jgi:hypothetical protein
VYARQLPWGYAAVKSDVSEFGVDGCLILELLKIHSSQVNATNTTL